MFDLGKIVEGITKAVSGGANTASMLSAFSNLDASKLQVVQAVMTAVQKVQFPELMELVKKGDYQALIAMVMSSKDSMPDFHKAFTEAGGEKALEEVTKSEETLSQTVDTAQEADAKVEAETVAKEVNEKTEEVKEDVSDKVEEVKEGAETVAENISDKIEETKDSVSDKAEEVKEGVAEKIEDLKN